MGDAPTASLYSVIPFDEAFGFECFDRCPSLIGTHCRELLNGRNIQAMRSLKCCIGFRTNSAGCPPIVPFGSIRMNFQHSADARQREARAQGNLEPDIP